MTKRSPTPGPIRKLRPKKASIAKSSVSSLVIDMVLLDSLSPDILDLRSYMSYWKSELRRAKLLLSIESGSDLRRRSELLSPLRARYRLGSDRMVGYPIGIVSTVDVDR